MKTLKYFYENADEFNKCLTMSNVDDMFRTLAIKGIKEVEVTKEEMFFMVLWTINFSKMTPIEIITEGKMDKFLGVRLIEI